MTDTTYDLPSWATLVSDEDRTVIRVEAGEMYPALLEAYAGHYEDGVPAEFGNAGQGLDPEAPTQYWLEVCRQSAKMDLWVALGTMLDVEIRLKGGHEYRLSEHPKGRGVEKASGGVDGARECVEHYRNLRGVLPAGVRA